MDRLEKLPALALRREDGRSEVLVGPGSGSEVDRGAAIRSALDRLRAENQVHSGDTLYAVGRADFGHERPLVLPGCRYATNPAAVHRGHRACWLTRCRIDRTSTKATGPGFQVGELAAFKHFDLAGDCWNKAEDGGLIGWAPENNPPLGVLELDDCLLDARGNMDWCVYNWSNNQRHVVIRHTHVRYSRFAVAMAASGAVAAQLVSATHSHFHGDAGDSTSLGASSGPDPETGGVLTAILNRRGTVEIDTCSFFAAGLTQEFSHRWGCPRVATIGTNWYHTRGGPTQWTIQGYSPAWTEPGISQVWSNLDLRGNAGQSLVLTPSAAGEPPLAYPYRLFGESP